MNGDEKDYVVYCLLCGSSSNLRLFPHRIQGQMVGWIFICEVHEDPEIPEVFSFERKES